MIKQLFHRPKHLNQFLTRQVDPMELFWDLIFVVTLRYIIEAYVSNYSFVTFVIGVLVFVEIFIVWTNISVYSVNFYNVSHNNRFFMTMMLLPLFFIASITDYSQVSSVYLLAASLTFTKIMQAIIWTRAVVVYKTNRFYQSINDIYQSEVKVYIILAVMSSLLFIVPHLLIPMLIVLIVIEIYLPSYLTKNRKAEFEFDRILIAERFLLFIILIFGEGFIGIVHIFQHSETLSLNDVVRGFLIFVCLYMMFLKFYDEYMIHKERISTTFMMYLTSYVLAIMLIVSALSVIGLSYHEIDPAVHAVALLGAITYNVVYIYNAYRYLTIRKQHLLQADIIYYKRDIIISSFSLIASILATVLIEDGIILLTVLSGMLVLGTLHIKLRAEIVRDIFDHDHELVKVEINQDED